MRNCSFALLLFCAIPAWAAHAYAQFGDIKYPPGFSHFEYARPDAPKGGEFSLVAPSVQTGFDKFNPFTLKGNAPPGLGSLVFETLLTSSLDEPTTAYGLLAQDVAVAWNRLSATFTLNPTARFHNGDPVLAIDVKHSFDQLMSQGAAPAYRIYFADIKGVTVLGERMVRFDFHRANAELPLIAGGLPVFSHKWGQGKPLDEVVTDLPIGSGPYRLHNAQIGQKDVRYVRDPDYWARDLNVRKGLYNFDRIVYRFYQDSIARMEAFKAGEFDLIQAFVAREWARAYKGKLFDQGTLIKRELAHSNPSGFQGFLFNLRRDRFKDVRVREAIALAMDYEWLNRQIFYGAYTRIRGYFTGSDFEAKELPGPMELAELQRLGRQVAPEVLTTPVPMPPAVDETAGSRHNLRDHLRRARDLLAAAGWSYRDGALRNEAGEAFTIEFLTAQGSMEPVITPFAKNLAKLGIELTPRRVDFALMQKRLDVFDFDMITIGYAGSLAPGVELMERYGSASAAIEGGGNLGGLKDPAVDALLTQVVSSRTRLELMARLRALDRVLRHGHYVVPHWYNGVHRVAWRAGRFEQPAVTPPYYQPEAWAIETWWATPANRQAATVVAQ